MFSATLRERLKPGLCWYFGALASIVL
uniref:Uncharacterized protein n=1 Tax=Arundo donax TaxID=35708 RepID=A0A0A8ZHD1_ARUDO